MKELLYETYSNLYVFPIPEEVCAPYYDPESVTLSITDKTLPDGFFDVLDLFLESHPELRTLDLSRCDYKGDEELSDEIYSILYDYPNIETLKLNFCVLEPQFEIPKKSKLKILELNNCEIDVDDLGLLTYERSLEKLKLEDIKFYRFSQSYSVVMCRLEGLIRKSRTLKELSIRLTNLKLDESDKEKLKYKFETPTRFFSSSKTPSEFPSLFELSLFSLRNGTQKKPNINKLNAINPNVLPEDVITRIEGLGMRELSFSVS